MAAVGLLAGVMMTGCSVLDTKSVKPGLFGDDAVKMMAAFDTLEAGKTTNEQWMTTGFDLSKAKNFTVSPGPMALRKILGEEVFQSTYGWYSAKGKVDELLADLAPYSMVEIPFKVTTKKESRFYISTKYEFTEGDGTVLTFVFKNGVLVYKAPSPQKFSEDHSNSAFAQGLFPWLKIVKDVKGVVE
ncbi:MAG: hypothetical protein A3I24_04010 [Candidatus Harrisonbacteria bacterium RIFCSPLOWO2_02_FULL_41_13b]|uniref:Uncharacterized protein n=1 Tax=Candidatus Harrisonbacteria bacterium RIFCSPLOWO2_02_FULL_41_13b TaxID=1798409 RepID=A0A1G1ZSL5_9BACT|nr:MAG: hypothetical protein A3I24_04010 [Candidatus Harrisonbacteria bacterium RIFCSPLOWO2_02_FULL_41_13b]